jgi:hypothetical protein
MTVCYRRLPLSPTALAQAFASGAHTRRSSPHPNDGCERIAVSVLNRCGRTDSSSFLRDIFKTRLLGTVDINLPKKHLERAHPQAVIAVVRPIDDQFLLCFRMTRNAQHDVIASLVMSISPRSHMFPLSRLRSLQGNHQSGYCCLNVQWTMTDSLTPRRGWGSHIFQSISVPKNDLHLRKNKSGPERL